MPEDKDDEESQDETAVMAPLPRRAMPGLSGLTPSQLP